MFRLIALAFAAFVAACSSGGGDQDAPDTVGTPATSQLAGVDGISAVFVLGDSLSDTGNAAGAADLLLSGDPVPVDVGLCNPAELLVSTTVCDVAFFKRSRVSDGPVAVEHLAAHLGVGELQPSLHVLPSRPIRGTNYAVASAKARGADNEDLATQVDLLILDTASLDPDALFVVMIGGNDALDAFQAELDTMPVESSSQIVTAAVNAIAQSVTRLLDFGARRIIVANVPDLAALPSVQARAGQAADPTTVLARARAISDAFDQELTVQLDGIRGRGQWNAPSEPRIADFDLLNAFASGQRKIVDDGGNDVDACFNSDAYRETWPPADPLYHPDCAPDAGGDPGFDEFAFWDRIHPTGTLHLAIGQGLIALL